jgi:tetratricopeptide (TPR) repeat protein
MKHEVSFNSSPVTIPAILFAVATGVTVIINSPNKIESLVTPQGAGGIIGITLWFLMVIGIVKAKETGWVVSALVVSGAILGLFAFLQILGIGANAFVGQNSLFSSKYWTPAGSLLSLILLLVALAPIVIVQFERALREYMRHETEGVMKRLLLYGISACFIVVAIIVILSQLLFTARPVVLPFSAGWTITLESLKNVQRALFGVGPGNYIFAYTTGRPGFMNITPYWNIRFLSAPNWYMQIITELGLVGLGAYVMLILGLVKKIFSYVNGLRNKTYRYDPLFLGLTLSLFVIIIEQLILPGNFLQLFLFYTLLALVSQYLVNNTYVEKSKILSLILAGLGILFVISTTYIMSRAYAAEYYMQRSVDYSTQNKARETYAYQTAALQTNPYIDRYHIIFSQTNLALATALSQKKNLSDKEKIEVITLLTQTTNEGKNAIYANPTNVQNWENLARIYKTMVNQVKDADRWSLQAYQQSIALDPLNPLLRLEAGGVFYSVGRFDLASQAFQETVNLKPDWANAYYNLGLSYKEQKNWQSAAAAIQRAIDLLPRDSKDKEKAQKDLDDVKKNIAAQPAASPSQSGDLNASTPPVPSASPTLTLPGNAAPDNAINRTQTESEKLRAPAAIKPQGE